MSDRTVDRVYRAVTTVLDMTAATPDEPLAVDTELISSGLIDSLHLVHLILALEAEFGVTIPGDAVSRFENFDTPDRIVALVGQLGVSDQSEAVASGPVDSSQIVPIGPNQTARDQKCRIFADGPRNYDLLILGSSQTMAFSAAAASERGYRAFNFSVNSALSEDWYCIFRFFLDYNRTPTRRVVIGIDIAGFSSQLAIDPRLLANAELCRYLDPVDQADAATEAEADTDDRFGEVQRGIKFKTPDGKRTFGYHGDTGDMVYLSDDPMCVDFNQRRPVQIADPTSCNQEYRLRTNSFGKLNPKRLGYLLRTVQPCLDNGLPVTCFLAPMHPQLRQFLRENTLYMDRQAEFVAGVKATETPLFQFVDCSDAASFGGSDDDFVDAAHMGAHNADLLLAHLLDCANRP